MSRLSVVIFLLLLDSAMLPGSTPAADDEAAGQAADRAEVEIARQTVRVLVTNEDGDAVAGATITPFGMRTRLERGSHYSWVADQHGKQPKVSTDENGIAEVEVPKFVYEKLEVGEITWVVDDANYVQFNGDRSVDDDPAKITLTRGRRIAVSAVDADTGAKLTENVHAMLSGSWGSDDWAAMKNGMLLSRAVEKSEPRTLRVFQIPDGGPIRFSTTIDLSDYGDELRVLLKDVQLHAGTRVEGTIDKQVPRPVANGVVTISVITGSDNNDWRAKSQWADWTPIREDGTFTFDSLPRGDVVQMIAVCDGWVSSHPEAKELEAAGMPDRDRGFQTTRVAPQVARLEGDRISPTVRMELTASCRIKVVDADGMPIPDAWVGMNPNQIWFGGGSQIVGDGYSLRVSLSLTEAQRNSMQNSSASFWDRRKLLAELGIASPASERYIATTDADGVAEIHTLPAGADDMPVSGTISVQHDDYEQPVGDDLRIRRETTVELRRGNVSDVTVTMDRKGTKVIGN
ncbi:MAG: hypothetical protein R3C19_26720 [Planctomycetaceae bacterium]